MIADESPNAARAPARLNALTGIRYVAAMLVLLHHLASRSGYRPVDQFLQSAGEGAVSLFFILSGFVLYWSNARADGTLNRNCRQFWVARIARIYPLYVFAFVMAAPPFIAHEIAVHPGPVHWGGRIALYAPLVLLLVQAWPWGFANAWNGPAWSLSVEAFFYAMFPFILKRLRGRLGHEPLVLFACWLTMAVPVVLIAALHRPHLLGMLQFFPPLRFPEIVGGMAIAQWVRRSPPAGGGILLACAAAGLAVAAGAFAPTWSYRLLAVPLLGALIALLAVPRRAVLPVLSSAPLVRLGAASYALYIVHIPLAIYYAELCGGHLVGGVLGFAAFATGVALLLHFMLEIPAADWINSRYGGSGDAPREADRMAVEG